MGMEGKDHEAQLPSQLDATAPAMSGRPAGCTFVGRKCDGQAGQRLSLYAACMRLSYSPREATDTTFTSRTGPRQKSSR